MTSGLKVALIFCIHDEMFFRQDSHIWKTESIRLY